MKIFTTQTNKKKKKKIINKKTNQTKRYKQTTHYQKNTSMAVPVPEPIRIITSSASG
jgi:hypothetical protein